MLQSEGQGSGIAGFTICEHTFATRLISRGTDLVTVQQPLGHASIEMAMCYSHSGANERRKAVALLSDGHHMDTTAASVVLYDSLKSLKTQNVRL